MGDSTTANESLDYAERWLRDGLTVLRPALSVQQITVDMTQRQRGAGAISQAGGCTPAQRICSCTPRPERSASNPHLHQMIAGTRRHRPDHVDIGLSVTGETFVSPVW